MGVYIQLFMRSLVVGVVVVMCLCALLAIHCYHLPHIWFFGYFLVNVFLVAGVVSLCVEGFVTKGPRILATSSLRLMIHS